MELLRDNKKMNEMGALIDDGIEGIEERLTEFRRVLSKMEIYFWKKKRFFFFFGRNNFVFAVPKPKQIKSEAPMLYSGLSSSGT
jgi:hypothetical protein